MRTKLTAAAAVMGLVVLALVGGLFGGDATGAPNQGPPANCDPAQEDAEVGAANGTDCATIEVTKVVTGTAPPGTTFPVRVVCPGGEVAAEGLPQADGPPVDKTLNLAAGETQSILLDNGAVCTISETPPAGCTLVSIDPDPVVNVRFDDVEEQGVIPVTVTNNCEVAAAPAAAVPAAPTFTG